MTRKILYMLPVVAILGCAPKPDPRVEALERELKELRDKQKVAEIAKEVVKAKTTRITGSVFIVTKGGTNFKLGLVTVKALPADEWRTHVSQMFTALNSRMESSALSYRASIEPYNSARRTANEMLAIYEEYRAPHDRARKKLEEFGTVFEALDQFMPRYGIDAAAARSALIDFREKYNALATAGSGLEAARDQIFRARSFALDSRRDAQRIYNTHINSIIELAESSNVVKTDADGKFELTLSRDAEYVLIATGSRSVGDEKEYYEWIVPIHITSDQEHLNVMLSNDSLSESIEPYSSKLYLMIPDELPEVPNFNIISERKTFKIN